MVAPTPVDVLDDINKENIKDASSREKDTPQNTETDPNPPPDTPTTPSKAEQEFTKQSEKLSHQTSSGSHDVAVEARFVTPQDAVIVTSDGNRLPGVPLEEAHKLNDLRDDAAAGPSSSNPPPADQPLPLPKDQDAVGHGNAQTIQKSAEGDLTRAMPPSHTNPLFPPLPLYGPPSLLRNLQCATFRASSFFLSLGFLGVIVLGSLFTSLPPLCIRAVKLLTFRDPDAERPFYEEEKRRAALRRELDRGWEQRRRRSRSAAPPPQDAESNKGGAGDADGFVPTEGGPDPIICDVGYYARRVGLDVEELQVQTEDGFVIDLWHVYDPREYEELPPPERKDRGPDVFTGAAPSSRKRLKNPDRPRKFPVLLMHGLLQSAGAYCCNDDDSLAFYLCKSGFDVWLGNNRCGFKPKHTLLTYSDPRMWCWNIRQMGVFDLPALVSRVVRETGFEKIGLVCHSQGTTQTLVALAKEQRPDLGERLTVFCALAPAAYAGPLIGKMYFKFMRVISPAMFRLVFGIHAFIPIMMTMHGLLNPRVYGRLGYKVFSFLFNWSDDRWDRGLRDRMFQFAPVYVSAESMRWWLGRECFARHKCILATKEEWRAEEEEDRHLDSADQQQQQQPATTTTTTTNPRQHKHHRRRRPLGATAWYNHQAPPFALWVCGRDDLVDGEKLLRRLDRGREPHVRVVHSRVIPEYEHLDVIWAMDAPDRVFSELRHVLWRTCGDDARARCRVPRGCEDVVPWTPDEDGKPEGGGGVLLSGESSDSLAE